jgi:hypothetical protein
VSIPVVERHHFVRRGTVSMAVSDQDLLEDKIQTVRSRDRRFSRQAYFFVLDALDYTMTHFGRDQLTGEDRHVGGRELLIGIKEYAADQFGPMAALVFDLIDVELLSRRPCDSRLDFVDGIDFRETFAEKHRERLDYIADR